MSETYVTLKWGTLKSWQCGSDRARELMAKYHELGCSISAMAQKDTPEQKEIICQLIDECTDDRIMLDWDGVKVPKDEAKAYVMNYGKPK
jgi:hypothetical protein